MHDQREFNILIVGSGPTGMTLATELARRGFKFRIIDAAIGPPPISESRALAFNLRSQNILRPCGATDVIVSQGHPLRHAVFQWQSKTTKQIDLKPLSKSGHHLIAIPQGRVERILSQRLNQLGSTTEWKTKLVSINNTTRKPTVTLEHESGESEVATFDFVMGCDGAHSAVRKECGFTFHGESNPQTWTLADIRLGHSEHAHQVTVNFYPGGASPSIAIRPDVVRIINTGDNVLGRHPLAEQAAEVIWKSDFRVSYRMVRQFSRGNVFLCGDAAHIHSPVGGRGMNLGIEDAATLAWLMSQNRQDEYSRIRLPIARKVLRITHTQTKLITGGQWYANFAKRRLLPMALGTGPIRRRFLKSLFGQDTPAPAWLTENSNR